MADTPDISKIINIIMQNPSLIEQIASLANSSDEAPEEKKADEAVSAPPVSETASETSVGAQPLMRAHRHDLINAMKPYLSEKRRSAIDSMSSILDVIDVMIKK